MWPIAREQRGRGLRAEAGQARESRRRCRRRARASRGSTRAARRTSRGRLRRRAGRRARRSSCTTLPPTHWPEVLVGRADDHLLDAVVGGRDRGRGAERVVGLELDHRPHRDAQRRQRVLEQRELRLRSGSMPGAVLVRRPTGRCGTTRSRGRSRRRGGWRRPRASSSIDATTARVAPTSTPSASRWPGRGARNWRKSSYVPSTRWTCTGASLSHGRAASRCPGV